MRKLLFSAVAAAAIGGLAPITSAPAVAAVCPLVGVDSDCQTLITLNAGNIVGITNGLKTRHLRHCRGHAARRRKQHRRHCLLP